MYPRGGVRIVYIVQAKPREAEGIIKVVKDTRDAALRAAKDFIDQDTMWGPSCRFVR
jgi:hypothetical protein